MLGTFLYAANAILPLILIIGLGYWLKRMGMFDEDFFKKANRLVFRVSLPVLLFYNIYNISDIQSLRMDVVGYSLVIIVILFVLGTVTVKFFIPDERQKGVILQSVFRSNYAIIGIPLAQSLGGAEAAATASLLSAFSIPLYNMLAVVCLSLYIHGDGKRDWRSVVRNILHNPLIIGVCCGVLALVIRALLPKGADGAPVFTIKEDLPFLYSAVKSVSEIASPLALVVLGGQFTFTAIRGMRRQIVLGTVWRLVLAPALGLIPAVLLSKYTPLLSFGMMEYPAMISLFGTPVAVSSVIMAGEMGNDETLAGQLVVWSSLFSILTLFVIIVTIRTVV